MAALLSVAGPLIYFVSLWNFEGRSSGVPDTATWAGFASLWLLPIALTIAAILLLKSAARRSA